MYNQYYQSVSAPVMGGQKPIKVTNTLTNEALALLKRGGVGDNVITVTEEDSARAICPHRNLRGEDTTTYNPDGSRTCNLCGENFKMVGDPEFVEQITDEVMNIFNTIKVCWLDIPVEFGREYMKIIPFVKQLPKVYRAAMASFDKFENQNTIGGVAGANPFTLYSSMMGAPIYGYPQQPQTQLVQSGIGPDGQPVYTQQPVQSQAPVATAPTVNGFVQQPYGSGVQSTAQAMQSNEVKLPSDAVTNTVTNTATLNLD